MGFHNRRRLAAAGLSILCLMAIPSAISTADDSTILEELLRHRAENAVLKARLALSKEPLPYMILDLPLREVRLELQGVTLTKFPLRRVVLNRLAREISVDTTRISFCEVPFVLQQEKWFEEVPTLALKDSAAVASSPDTTGALAERIRTARVLAMLTFERNLVIGLHGNIPPESRGERWRLSLKTFWRSMKKGTAEWALRRERRESLLVEIEMEPALVRSLAPNLTDGTKLVLLF
ncbi:MAG: hypothetical protein FJY88_09985 [Candidatus Eisenbacteria bacterium]|nr:hypothetical protein [Candidatus Eisenbacteria bacterium]